MNPGIEPRDSKPRFYNRPRQPPSCLGCNFLFNSDTLKLLNNFTFYIKVISRESK